MKKLLSFLLLTLITITSFNIATAQQVGDTDDLDTSCINLSNNMRFRSRDANTNGEVSDLQDFLISEGYISGNTTGYFGLLTQKAVKSFQSRNNLISSGIVGAVTRAKIKDISCNTSYTNPVTPPVSAIPTNPITPIACTMEMRFCSDGLPMQRDANCNWRSDLCKTANPINALPRIDSVSASKDYMGTDTNYFKILITGTNLNKVNYIEEEHLVDGKQTINRGQFSNASDNQIALMMKVCAGCSYNSNFNLVDGNGNKSNVMNVKVNNIISNPNSLKTGTAVISNITGFTNTNNVLHKSYKPDETIYFSLDAKDSKGMPATPENGFNVQWRISDNKDGSYINSTTFINGEYLVGNAVFNYSTMMWDINARAPKSNLANGQKREIRAVFYCGNVNAVCYSPDSYNQIEKSFLFDIDASSNNNTTASVKLYNVLGNQMTKGELYLDDLGVIDQAGGISDNNYMLGRVELVKSKYKELSVIISCRGIHNTMSERADQDRANLNFSVTAQVKLSGVTTNTLNCREDHKINKNTVGFDYSWNLPLISKDFETITYEVTNSGTWNTSYINPTRKQPLWYISVYGLNADGSYEMVYAIPFIMSIKG